MYRLEKYNGRNRYRCPRCGSPRDFVRYVNDEEEQVSPEVGKCNRDAKCGYHYTPRQFFADNPASIIKNSGEGKRLKTKDALVAGTPKGIDFIPTDVVGRSLVFNGKNNFDRFLLSLFLEAEVHCAMNRYRIGTWTSGRTVFWQIDNSGRIRTGKLIAYDPMTGKRNKFTKVSWVHVELARTGALPSDFRLEQSFFGEHLLAAQPEKAVAIVESEKTAIVASIVMPGFLWLATGGALNLSLERLARVARGRHIVLFPDSSKFSLWSAKAEKARRLFGLDVQVSDLLERRLTKEEKREDYDIADFLIADRQKMKNES